MVLCPYGTRKKLLAAQVLSGILVLLSGFAWWPPCLSGAIAFCLVMLAAFKEVDAAPFLAAQGLTTVAAGLLFAYARFAKTLGATLWCQNDEVLYYNSFTGQYEYYQPPCNYNRVLVYSLVVALLWAADTCLIRAAKKDLFDNHDEDDQEEKGCCTTFVKDVFKELADVFFFSGLRSNNNVGATRGFDANTTTTNNTPRVDDTMDKVDPTPEIETVGGPEGFNGIWNDVEQNGHVHVAVANDDTVEESTTNDAGSVASDVEMPSNTADENVNQ